MSQPDPLPDGDRVARAPRWTDLVAEGCALARDCVRPGRIAAPADLPRGDEHTVLVIPALFSSDRLTRGFRAELTQLGYDAAGWGAGVNLGPTPVCWASTAARLAALARRSGRKISLVGHSLGGVLARALASERPELVRRVITICSPFRPPTADLPMVSPLLPIYRLLSRWHLDDNALMARLAEPPPVPTTAIYSRDDGVVSWRSCVDEVVPLRQNVAVDGPHSTMLANPLTIRVVAEHLCRL